MSVEATTKALHEYMYDKLNDSLIEIGYLNKRKTRTTKEPFDKPAKLKKLDSNECEAPNWSRQHDCPAWGKMCEMRKDQPLRELL